MQKSWALLSLAWAFLLAGVVDPRTGDITYANELMPGWGGTALGSAVTSEFGLPCSVLNDVHAHALGEARHGDWAMAKIAF